MTREKILRDLLRVCRRLLSNSMERPPWWSNRRLWNAIWGVTIDGDGWYIDLMRLEGDALSIEIAIHSEQSLLLVFEGGWLLDGAPLRDEPKDDVLLTCLSRLRNHATASMRP